MFDQSAYGYCVYLVSLFHIWYYYYYYCRTAILLYDYIIRLCRTTRILLLFYAIRTYTILCCDGFTIHIGGKLRQVLPNYTYVMCSVHSTPAMSFEKISYGNNNISSDFRHKLKRISVVLYTRECNIIIIILWVRVYIYDVVTVAIYRLRCRYGVVYYYSTILLYSI